jgi:nucleotide-binding universal stress UspA family protein
MKQTSILLALDGSQESQQAAELAWNLAKVMKAKIVAQTVVDNDELWQMLGQERPGFIGSGPYLAAYESAHVALKSAAEHLLSAYQSRALAQGIDSECLIDEGNIVEQISRRAQEHDLVIVGHKLPEIPRRGADRFRFSRSSLGERLIYSCAQPLLIVSDRCPLWESAKFVVSEHGYDLASLKLFLKFALQLGIQREIYCVAAQDNFSDMVLNIRSLIPKQERIYVTGRQCSQLHSAWQKALDVSADTLAVIPVTSDADGTKLCFGKEASAFAHELHLPAMLFLPVEAKLPISPARSYGKLAASR